MKQKRIKFGVSFTEKIFRLYLPYPLKKVRMPVSATWGTESQEALPTLKFAYDRANWIHFVRQKQALFKE